MLFESYSLALLVTFLLILHHCLPKDWSLISLQCSLRKKLGDVTMRFFFFCLIPSYPELLHQRLWVILPLPKCTKHFHQRLSSEVAGRLFYFLPL